MLLSVTNRIAALDGLRAFAIGLVIISHAVLAVDAVGHQTGLMALLSTYLGDGGLGVDVFFVLSGFLITMLLLHEQDTKQKISLRNFYERRVRRILPVFYIWLAVIAVLAVSHRVDQPSAGLLGAALFVYSYLPSSDQSWWTGNAWTLCVEEWFYLCFPALLILMGRKIVPLLILIVIAEPAVRVVQFMLQHDYDVYYQVHARLDQLACGCLLGFALRDERIVKWFATRKADVAVSVAFLTVFIVVPTIDMLVHHLLFWLLFGLSLDGIGLALILGYIIQRPLGVTARVLSAKPIVWIGSISYSLYLWQQLFITQHDPLPWPVKGVATVACAAGSYYLIERPFVAGGRARAIAARQSSSKGHDLSYLSVD